MMGNKNDTSPIHIANEIYRKRWSQRRRYYDLYRFFLDNGFEFASSQYLTYHFFNDKHLPDWAEASVKVYIGFHNIGSKIQYRFNVHFIPYLGEISTGLFTFDNKDDVIEFVSQIQTQLDKCSSDKDLNDELELSHQNYLKMLDEEEKRMRKMEKAIDSKRSKQ